MSSPKSTHRLASLSGRRSGAEARRAVTLLELLLALSVMVMVAGALAAITRAVQMGFEYSRGYGTATQHARVAMQRICRTVNEATASASFPGFKVVAEQEGACRFPDALAVWFPEGAASDPDGLPLFEELKVYLPDPSQPSRLLEVTLAGNTNPVPEFDDEAGWATAIGAMRGALESGNTPSATGLERAALTDLLRTARVSGGADSEPRAAVRFEAEYRPADGSADWVQGVQGSDVGLCQAWLRIELQLVPESETNAGAGASSGRHAIPFLGSAAVYYLKPSPE
jgi:hypothetical protein